MFIFYYFLKRNLTGEVASVPVPFDCFIGDVGEFCEIDGVGYTIMDYVVEEMI